MECGVEKLRLATSHLRAVDVLGGPIRGCGDKQGEVDVRKMTKREN